MKRTNRYETIKILIMATGIILSIFAFQEIKKTIECLEIKPSYIYEVEVIPGANYHLTINESN